jgi:hypothetical protein
VHLRPSLIDLSFIFSIRITARETELDIEATRVSVEWRNRVIPLREWVNVVITTVQEDSHTLDMDDLKKTRADIEVFIPCETMISGFFIQLSIDVLKCTF